MKKVLKKTLLGFLILLLIFISYFFIGSPPQAEKITWGVNFSQKHAQDLGLNWQESYLALLDDLKIKNIKLITHWDLIEPKEGEYNFDDLDWQINEAEKREVKIILVIGLKTGRWPECHIPAWARNLTKEEQQKEILEILEKIVLRYKDNGLGPTPKFGVGAWQVENEPFFPFGECPKIEKNFVKEEIKLVKVLDFERRPIIISDSGEFSFWIKAAQLGDIVGTTLHRRVWAKEFRIYVTHYWFRPVYYWRKAQIIKKLFNKEVVSVEFQAEPWCPTLLYDCSLEEQKKTMNLEQFKKNIEFAKKTGFDTIYLWGGEWWYWLKVKQGDSSVWDEARKLWLSE